MEFDREPGPEAEPATERLAPEKEEGEPEPEPKQEAEAEAEGEPVVGSAEVTAVALEGEDAVPVDAPETASGEQSDAQMGQPAAEGPPAAAQLPEGEAHSPPNEAAASGEALESESEVAPAEAEPETERPAEAQATEEQEKEPEDAARGFSNGADVLALLEGEAEPSPEGAPANEPTLTAEGAAGDEGDWDGVGQVVGEEQVQVATEASGPRA